MATPEGNTNDGFELQFGTNYPCHFLLFRAPASCLPCWRCCCSYLPCEEQVALDEESNPLNRPPLLGSSVRQHELRKRHVRRMGRGRAEYMCDVLARE
ncbi:hypothetical protein BJX68DRAFT_250027 [Aspergillus pseudodeflectus]|uniref:Uncharacterized protein n=1 Tax=Aspergillus pseudodeflectus TaxID=176178 RepID=A0ABR4JAK4_9EURO